MMGILKRGSMAPLKSNSLAPVANKGTVYRAKDCDTEQLAACKAMTRGYFLDEQRLVPEVDAL